MSEPKTTDQELEAAVQADPFHQGLLEHGDAREALAMSDEEVAAAQARLGKKRSRSATTGRYVKHE